MKKKGKKKSEGFTLIEVLAVIVILGILSTIGIITLTNIRKSQEKNFDQTQYDLFKETAKTYFLDNKFLLPTVPNSTNIVYLEDLIKGNYLDSLLDYDKNSYSLDSYVEIKKIGANKYFYTVNLYKKGSHNIPGMNPDKNEPKIEINNYRKDNNTELISVENNGKKTYFSNTTVTASVNIKDNDGIMAFCYIIYKNNVKIYTSEYIEVDNSNSAKDIFVLDVNNYGDGTYQIEVVVYDNKNHVKSEKKDSIMIDRVPPTCTTTKTPNLEWTNSETIIKGTCSDNKGKTKGNSGCKTASTSESEIKNEGIYNISPGVISDKAGNKTTCDEIPVRIDKTPPSCSSSGGSTSWTKSSRTLEGKCSDSGSGCKGNISKVIDKEGSFTNLSPGTVSDNAGNSKECPADQTVKIDRTNPTCGTINVSGTKGFNDWYTSNVTLTATNGSDSLSGHATTTIDKTSITTDTTETIVTLTTTDNAGNSCTTEKTVKIDKTPPTCESSGGVDAWGNTVLTISGKCSDNTSKCTKDVENKINTDTSNSSLSPGEVFDNAGNKTECPGQPVYRDFTPPNCTSSGGSEAWTNDSRTLVGQCSDSGSGCRENTSKVIDTEGSFTNLSPGIVYDNAGNAKECPANQTVKIDKTPPTCTVYGGSNEWINKNSDEQSRTITATCSDSGGSNCIIKSFSYKYETDINTTVAGANGNNNGGTVSDNAGNSVSCSANQTVKIDKTSPELTVSTEYCTYEDPCNNNHRLSSTASDNLSGVSIIKRRKMAYNTATKEYDIMVDKATWDWYTYPKRTVDGVVYKACSYSPPASTEVKCISDMLNYYGKVKWDWKVCDAAGNCTQKSRIVYNKEKK